MTESDPSPEECQSPIEPEVISHAAERADADENDVANALAVLDAELLGRHSEFEHDDYVIVEGTRAYRVDDERWDAILASFELEEPVVGAVRRAHAEQARALYERADRGGDFGDDDAGVVVGMKTAERMG